MPSNQEHGRAARGGFFSAAILWARLRSTGRCGVLCCERRCRDFEESAGESGSRAMVSKGFCPCPLRWILPEAGAGRQRLSVLWRWALYPLPRGPRLRRALSLAAEAPPCEGKSWPGQAFYTVLLWASHQKVVLLLSRSSEFSFNI